jgi:hypothetical protein
LLVSFSQDIQQYKNDPIFNFYPFSKIDSNEHRKEFLISKEFPLIDVIKMKTNKNIVPFPQYRDMLDQVFYFFKEFLYLFESSKLSNLAKEMNHFLKISNGDMELLETNLGLLQKSPILIHPSLLLFNSKFIQVRSRIFKYMRTSIQYSYQKDLLYLPNNVLHFVLHWNQMFLPNCLSECSEESDLNIFTSKSLCETSY